MTTNKKHWTNSSHTLVSVNGVWFYMGDNGSDGVVNAVSDVVNVLDDCGVHTLDNDGLFDLDNDLSPVLTGGDWDDLVNTGTCDFTYRGVRVVRNRYDLLPDNLRNVVDRWWDDFHAAWGFVDDY